MKQNRISAFAVCLFVLFGAMDCAKAIPLKGFQKTGAFGEQQLTITNSPGVRILLNAPASDSFPVNSNITLILYGLPNGNSIEHTAGKKVKEGDDWHFDIQHIAAQTRFIRRVLTNETVIVAYLENSLKSWPAWRKQHGDAAIPDLITAVKNKIGSVPGRVILTGHSGGGSLTFGYLNSVEKIPDEIERIGFLDSNYAYSTGLHRDKLLQWLHASPKHALLVFAYHDDVALLNGKPFVSATGGTWGRSHQMRKDFEPKVTFKEKSLGEIKVWTALDDRMQFFLKENLEKKIYHTVQVDRNGFIHAVLAGTPHENQGYRYFGPRAYTEFIQN